MNNKWSCPQSPNLSISFRMDFCLLLMICLRLLNPTTHVAISLTEFVRRRKRTPLTVLMIVEVSIVLYVFVGLILLCAEAPMKMVFPGFGEYAVYCENGLLLSFVYSSMIFYC